MAITTEVDDREIRIRISRVGEVLQKYVEPEFFQMIAQAIQAAVDEVARKYVEEHREEIFSKIDQQSLANAIFLRMVAQPFPKEPEHDR